MFKRTYKYFVSYTFPNGSGMIEITRNKPIKTYSDVMSVAEFIKDNYVKTGNVVIVNYKKIKWNSSFMENWKEVKYNGKVYNSTYTYWRASWKIGV